METTGISKPIIQDKKRLRPLNSEVERLYGCNKLIKTVTNWEPKFSGIDGFKNGTIQEYYNFDSEKDQFHYLGIVNVEQSCLECHKK